MIKIAFFLLIIQIFFPAISVSSLRENLILIPIDRMPSVLGSLQLATKQCSKEYCIDPNCIPQICPPMVSQFSQEITRINQLHASFLNFINSISKDLSSQCTANESPKTMGFPITCDPASGNPKRPSLSFSFLPFLGQNTGYLGSSIPAGAVIFSYKKLLIGGWLYNEVIYFYQGKYCYICECSGVWAGWRLLATQGKNLVSFPTPFNWFNQELSVKVQKSKLVCKTPVARAMLADDLTTILKCVPDIQNFVTVPCMSKKVLQQIFPSWDFTGSS